MKIYFSKSVYLLLIVIISCHYKENTNTTYMGYYDKTHTQLKVKGEIINGRENGLWEYYDENGNRVQYGDYSNGIPEGIWVYEFTLFDTSVVWKPYHDVLRKFTFSLPESFQEYKLDFDTSVYASVDTGTGDVFSVRDLGVTTQIEYESYFEKNKTEFGFDSEVINSSSIIVKSDSMSYSFDKFLIRHKEKKIEAIHYDLYTLINDSMVLISYTCSPKDSIKGKFFIGEIFCHTVYDQKRIGYPFHEVKTKLR